MVKSKRGEQTRTPEKLAFGSALILLRTKTGLKQQELAAVAKISKAMLSSYETGKSYPAMETLIAILGAMGADFRSLQGAIDALSGGESVISFPLKEAEARETRQREIGKALLTILSNLRLLDGEIRLKGGGE